jgi:hypothetical protein
MQVTQWLDRSQAWLYSPGWRDEWFWRFVDPKLDRIEFSEEPIVLSDKWGGWRYFYVVWGNA